MEKFIKLVEKFGLEGEKLPELVCEQQELEREEKRLEEKRRQEEREKRREEEKEEKRRQLE